MNRLLSSLMLSAVFLCGTANTLSAAQGQNTANAINDIVYITRDNLQSILTSQKPVIIDVYTDWCGPCKALAPIFKQLNDSYGDHYVFAKLNGDDSYLANQFQIQKYPTIIFRKDGLEVGRHVGFLNKDSFVQKINNLFGK